ncbi:MAG: hypothetical protein IJ187_08420 [Neisseriaceae bacterium]|nr:hypothetical protein [Neisseriaceae bacterium]MBQ9724432.1 hypothetical protein [Neisseriaceae bacterium]
MKSQKIVAMLVAVAMSSAGFAKEVVTRVAPIPVKQSFESQVFDLDGKQNLSAVELTPTEMQETQGEFFPIVAGIALGAAAIGMWLKHTESKVTTGDWASSKEVAKAGAIDGGLALVPGGAVVSTAKKAKTAVTVGKAVTTTNKVTTATKTTGTTIGSKTSLNNLTKPNNVVDLSKKAPNSVYNQYAVNKLNSGTLVGITKNGKLGSPREMPITRNPNATAQDFVQKYGQLNGGLVKAETIPMKNGEIFTRYQLGNGGFINFRHVGAASNRTAPTTATVEINNAQIKAINGDKALKLKFPKRSIMRK